ncbi:MAG: glycosyltransferase [Prevotella sp.]|nr:glycosyltransferase [Prevotella sp.]
MPKVSIIIAVYNAERFLRRCIESLTAQTYGDLQIIFVDDGSNDQSLKLIKEFADVDSRVEYVSLPENRGLPCARNAGLALVNGDLVCTLDADDWLSTDAIEQAVRTFESFSETDCVMFRFVYVDETTNEEKEFPMTDFDVLSGKEAMKRTLLEWNGLHGIYMVRAAIHLRYPFDETTRVYSDENTARLHFFASREVRKCKGTYYYRQHAASLTHSGTMGYFDRLLANESLLHQLQSEGVDAQVVQTLYDRCWLGVVDAYYYYWLHHDDFSADERETALRKIKKAWENVDVSKVSSIHKKFGYWPCKSSWNMFRLQEKVYFFLKSFKATR